MKKYSKSVLALLMVSLLVTLNSVAFAANAVSKSFVEYQFEPGVYIDLNDSAVTYENAATWAYQNYSTASNSDKANILLARSILMEQVDWAADGHDVFYYSASTGTTEKLPAFSEVFPGWDYEQMCEYNKLLNQILKISPRENQYGRAWINVPAAGNTRAPVVARLGTEDGIQHYITRVLSTVHTETCNIGFSIDGDQVALKEDMIVGDHIFYDTKESYIANGRDLDIRISTYSTPGPMEFEFIRYDLQPTR